MSISRCFTFFAALLTLAVVSSSGCSRSTKFGNLGFDSTKIANLPSVQLAWDAPVQNDGSLDTSVTGYRIYYGLATRDYLAAVDVGQTLTARVKNLPSGTVYFTATAYNSSGAESDYSNEVSAVLKSGSSGSVGFALANDPSGTPVVPGKRSLVKPRIVIDIASNAN